MAWTHNWPVVVGTRVQASHINDLILAANERYHVAIEYGFEGFDFGSINGGPLSTIAASSRIKAEQISGVNSSLRSFINDLVDSAWWVIDDNVDGPPTQYTTSGANSIYQAALGQAWWTDTDILPGHRLKIEPLNEVAAVLKKMDMHFLSEDSAGATGSNQHAITGYNELKSGGCPATLNDLVANAFTTAAALPASGGTTGSVNAWLTHNLTPKGAESDYCFDTWVNATIREENNRFNPPVVSAPTYGNYRADAFWQDINYSPATSTYKLYSGAAYLPIGSIGTLEWTRVIPAASAAFGRKTLYGTGAIPEYWKGSISPWSMLSGTSRRGMEYVSSVNIESFVYGINYVRP